MSRVHDNLDMLLTTALAPNTQAAYQRSWCKFVEFAQKFGLSAQLPVSTDNILKFISYLHLNKVPFQSITPILSAISYKHKLSDLTDPCKSFKVSQVLNSVKRINPKVQQKFPITLTLLQKMVNSLCLLGLSEYETSLFKSMFTIQFYFALRIGELTDSQHNITLEQVLVKQNSLTINFRTFKHSSSFTSCPHEVHRVNNHPCPVVELKNYLANRDKASGPLFKLDNKPVPRHVYNNKIKTVLQIIGEDTTNYSAHSFRIGATTYWASKGMSELQIKQLGRWKSDAIFKYLRGPISHNI